MCVGKKSVGMALSIEWRLLAANTFCVEVPLSGGKTHHPLSGVGMYRCIPSHQYTQGGVHLLWMSNIGPVISCNHELLTVLCQ